MELPEIADIVARWAAQFDRLETVYIFGSRVRGDHRPDSDLDIALDFNYSGFSAATEPIDDEMTSNFAGLKALLPNLKISIHHQHDDDAWAEIRSSPCKHSQGKVRCILTRRRSKPPSL